MSRRRAGLTARADRLAAQVMHRRDPDPDRLPRVCWDSMADGLDPDAAALVLWWFSTLWDADGFMVTRPATCCERIKARAAVLYVVRLDHTCDRSQLARDLTETVPATCPDCRAVLARP